MVQLASPNTTHIHFGLTGKKVDSVGATRDLNLQRTMHHHASNTAGVANKRRIGICECTQQDKAVFDKHTAYGNSMTHHQSP